MNDYQLLCAQLKEVISDVPEMISNYANASALLYESLPDLNWAGFYFLKGDKLILGPFQGRTACTEIPVGKGVCGTAVKENRTQLVSDVHCFPGHIACDSVSNSEIVVPVRDGGRIIAVLDIDSPVIGRFSEEDREGLKSFVSVLEEKLQTVGTENIRTMKASEMIEKYLMDRHPENGVFIEKHYVPDEPGRADSGSILYYVAPGENTEFHRIDCDEYWCHNAGENLEIWSFTPEGTLRKQILGTSGQAEPFVFFRRGEIFASRLPENSPDGALVTCISVPRFNYEGFEILEKEKMLALYPESSGFWNP